MPNMNDDNTSQLRAQAFEAVRAFVAACEGCEDGELTPPRPTIQMLSLIGEYLWRDADTLHIDCERRTAERNALGTITRHAPDFDSMYIAAKAALVVRDMLGSEPRYAQRQYDADGVLWYDPFLKPGEELPINVRASNAEARGLYAHNCGRKNAAILHYDDAMRLYKQWAAAGDECDKATASHAISRIADKLDKLEGDDA